MSSKYSNLRMIKNGNSLNHEEPFYTSPYEFFEENNICNISNSANKSFRIEDLEFKRNDLANVSPFENDNIIVDDSDDDNDNEQDHCYSSLSTTKSLLSLDTECFCTSKDTLINNCNNNNNLDLQSPIKNLLINEMASNMNESSSTTTKFNCTLTSPPTISSICSDDYLYGPSSGEFSSSSTTNGGDEQLQQQPQQSSSSSSSLNDNWILMSKNDNFQLKIEPHENYVCFISADIFNRQQLQQHHQQQPMKKNDHHAILIYANGSFHIKDLDSKFGTFVNEIRVPSRSFIRLNIDDEIRFGFGPDIYQLKHLQFQSNQSSEKLMNQIFYVNNNHENLNNNLIIVDDDHEDDDGVGVNRDKNQYQSTKPSFNNNKINDFIVIDDIEIDADEADDNRNNNSDKYFKLNSIKNKNQSSSQPTPTTTVTTAAKQSPIMNKLFRISIRKNDNKKKNDSNNRVAKKNATSTSSSTSSTASSSSTSNNHKLSPSSFSLMSSSSSSSSSKSSTMASTTITTTHQPQSSSSSSSMFMSAMKMVKAKFKKKSPTITVSTKDKKESSLFICSGNDDITFIRYHHHQPCHNDNNNNQNHHLPIKNGQQYKIEPCSISAPESPNQTRHNLYHSHTYQNTEFLRKFSDDYPINKLNSRFLFTMTDEHEYDEVTPDLNDDDDVYNDVDDDDDNNNNNNDRVVDSHCSNVNVNHQQQWTCKTSEISTNMNDDIHHHNNNNEHLDRNCSLHLSKSNITTTTVEQQIHTSYLLMNNNTTKATSVHKQNNNLDHHDNKSKECFNNSNNNEMIVDDKFTQKLPQTTTLSTSTTIIYHHQHQHHNDNLPYLNCDDNCSNNQNSQNHNNSLDITNNIMKFEQLFNDMTAKNNENMAKIPKQSMINDEHLSNTLTKDDEKRIVNKQKQQQQQELKNESHCQNVISSSLASSSTTSTSTNEQTKATIMASASSSTNTIVYNNSPSSSSLLHELYTNTKPQLQKQQQQSSSETLTNNSLANNNYKYRNNNNNNFICQNEQKDLIIVSDDCDEDDDEEEEEEDYDDDADVDGDINKNQSSSTISSYFNINKNIREIEKLNSNNKTIFKQWLPLTTASPTTTTTAKSSSSSSAVTSTSISAVKTVAAAVNETTLDDKNNLIEQDQSIIHKRCGRKQLVVVPVDSDSGAVTDADTNDLYDIEDIGHLRRVQHQQRPSSSSSSSTKVTNTFEHYHTGNFLASTSSGQSSLGTSATLANFNNENELSSLENDVEFSYKQQNCINTSTKQPNSLPVFLHQPRSRHSIGGMAFVIDFDDNSDNKNLNNIRKASPILFSNRKNNNFSNDIDHIKQQKQLQQQITHSKNLNTSNNDITMTSAKRLSTVSATSVPTKTNIAYVFDINDMNDKQKSLNSSGHTRHQSLSASMKKSDTYDKKLNKLLLTNDCQSINNNNNEIFSNSDTLKNSTDNNNNNNCSNFINSSTKMSKENSNRIKSGHRSSIDMIKDDTIASDSMLKQRQQHPASRSSGQLSESAVYLINRMFEHNDNYRNHYDRNIANEQCFDLSNHNDHVDARLSHGVKAKSSNKTSIVETNLNNKNFESSNDRNKKFDDDSSNLTRDQTVQSHRSSLNRHYPKSINNDIATIDSNTNLGDADNDHDNDDGELSDTGTYVIDYDEITGEKHKRKSKHNSNNNSNNVMNSKKGIRKSSNIINGAQPEQHFENNVDQIPIKSSNEDLGVGNRNNACHNDGEGGNGEINSDEFGYDEDYDVEDEEPKEDDDIEDEDVDDDDDDDEDKLEIARKQIDELFNNYEKQKNNNQLIKKDATFTRTKRRSSCSEVGNQSITYHDDKSFHPNSMSNTQKSSSHSFDIIEDDSKATMYSTNYGDKSKKKISSELMSAFKRINSKLEKTARLGKLSLLSSTQTAAVAASNDCTSNDKNGDVNANEIDKNNIKNKKSTTYKMSAQCSSAPSTPMLNDRQHLTNGRLCNQNLNRKSIKTPVKDYSSSPERLDHDNHRQQRERSGSLTSNTSTSSNLRFNRAFALRRARLGMDTCGVEISEQSANKAKESQKSNASVATKPSFKRNDGGRFSLRVPSARASTANAVTKSVQKPPSSSSAANQSINRKTASKQSTTLTKIPTIKSLSACSSVSSSIENFPTISTTKTKRHCQLSLMNKPPRKTIPHSDNEIQFDAEYSSCDDSESQQPLQFTRFGRRSLRCVPTSTSGSIQNSTPWLKTFASTNKSLRSTSTVIDKRTDSEKQTRQLNQVSYSLFGNGSHNENNKPRKSSNECQIAEQQNYNEPSSPSILDHRATKGQIIPPFQVGKRFFSTKPHRMAQFDKDFNNFVNNHHSASANHSPMRQLSADPNLMTHSVTECLLSDRSNKRHETKSNEVPADSAAITSSINARIFSISPLDSLVISAINQLSSKLRTRMCDFLERERSNYLSGSEARSLIDEILPQVNNNNGNTVDSSKSNQSRNNYNHDSSNISRDLSNTLKNLKKVEQIFDVFSMIVEPHKNDSRIGVHETDSPIVTIASDSDTSGDGVGDSTASTIEKSNNDRNNVMNNRFRRPPFIVPTVQQQRQLKSNRIHSHSQQSSPPDSFDSSTSSQQQQPRSGFFIEI